MKNVLDFLKQFNWIDIFVFCLALRIAFIALKNGLAAEVFKILGTFTGLYLGMHYYGILGAFFCGPLGPKSPALPTFETGSFVVLFAAGYVGFWLIRILICRLATTQVVPQLSKWGGFALGLWRALLTTGIVLFGLTIANTPYFKKSIRTSFSGTSLVKIAPAVYSWTWNNLFSKFMPKEKFNKSVLEVK